MQDNVMNFAMLLLATFYIALCFAIAAVVYTAVREILAWRRKRRSARGANIIFPED